MTNLIRDWKLKEYPNLDVPRFRYSHPIGPNFAALIFRNTTTTESFLECYDYIFCKERSYIESPLDLESGDSIFLLYDSSLDWVYVFSTDLGWAVLLSNIPFHTTITDDQLSKAKDDFYESFSKRTFDLQLHYDRALLNCWLHIWNIEDVR